MTWEASTVERRHTMGILDDLLGSALAGASGQQRSDSPTARTAGAGGQRGVLMALLPVLLSMLANRGAGQTGGGLGDIVGQVLGGRSGGGGGNLGDILGGVLGRGATAEAGGLGGLLEQMERAGLGNEARSWVGTGQNMPISPEAFGRVFGEDGVAEIARRAGLTPKQTSDGLSELLPEVVDRVTPEGQVPDFDQLIRSVEDLQRRTEA